MNWGSDFFFGEKTYELIGRHTNELEGIRMNSGSSRSRSRSRSRSSNSSSSSSSSSGTCVFKFIHIRMIALRYERMPSKKKVSTRVHSYAFEFIRMSSNSFVNLPPQKKAEPQFIRMSSNSFVSLPPKKKGLDGGTHPLPEPLLLLFSP